DVVDPEQIVCGDAVTVGVGFTVTSTVIAVPVQPLANGVIVYVTVAGVEPVSVSVCAIGLPLPLLAPLTLAGALAVQVNVVPVTVPFSTTDVVDPEQIVCGDAVTVGVGFTVTSTVIAVPVQPLANGVIVYVTVAGVEPV